MDSTSESIKDLQLQTHSFVVEILWWFLRSLSWWTFELESKHCESDFPGIKACSVASGASLVLAAAQNRDNAWRSSVVPWRYFRPGVKLVPLPCYFAYPKICAVWKFFGSKNWHHLSSSKYLRWKERSSFHFQWDLNVWYLMLCLQFLGQICGVFLRRKTIWNSLPLSVWIGKQGIAIQGNNKGKQITDTEVYMNFCGS